MLSSKLKVVLQLVLLLVIGSGLVVGVQLVQQRQEIRREAAGEELVLSLSFDDHTNDASVLENHGITSGNTQFVEGKNNNALHFDENKDSVLVVKKNTLDFASHINFKGLNFSHTDWELPQTGYPGIQGDLYLHDPWSAIYFDTAQNMGFENNTVKNIGTYAVGGEFVKNLNISGNEITDTGSGGVRLGNDRNIQLKDIYSDYITSNNTVSDNRIHDIGNVYLGTNGIFLLLHPNNTISHNLLYNAPNTGINVGWGAWDTRDTYARDNIIEQNIVHDVMKIMNDGAAIHIIGKQPGTIIRNNVFHDIFATRHHITDRLISGIYLDGGSSLINVTNNIVFRTQVGGLFFNQSYNNTATNNILLEGQKSQLYRTAYPDEINGSYTDFEKNIIYYTGSKTPDGQEVLLFDYRNPDIEGLGISDYNLYYHPTQSQDPGSIFSQNLNWFKGYGYEQNSIVEDPLFTEYGNGNYTLLPESPAFSLGIQQIDTSRVGPRIACFDNNDCTSGRVCIQKTCEDPGSVGNPPDDNLTTNIYIATNGNDSADGTINSPFLTLNRARDKARELKDVGNFNKPVNVFLRGGTYFIDQTFKLTSEDSGTADLPISYQAYPKEKVTITSGKQLNLNWQNFNSNIYVADVSSFIDQYRKFNSLFINDKRATRARIPNKDEEFPYHRIVYREECGRGIANQAPCKNNFIFSDGNIDPNWRNLQEVEIISLRNWIQARSIIDRIEGSTAYVTGRIAGHFGWDYNLNDGFNDRYYVENVFEGLDSEGEWYLDMTEKKLYYWPESDESINSSEFIVPTLNQLLEVKGTSETELNMGTSDFTLSAWFKPESAGTSGRFIISKGGQREKAGYSIFLRASNKLGIDISDGQDFIDASSNTIFQDGEWYHAAVVWDSTAKKMTLYVDGEPDKTTTNTNINSVVSDELFAIGNRVKNLQNFFGAIDEVKIYRRALSADEVTNLYNEFNVTPTPTHTETPTPTPTITPTPTPTLVIKPDLAATALSISPSEPGHGENLSSVSITVNNTGTLEVNQSLQFRVSIKDTTSDVYTCHKIANFNVNLSPGASSIYNFTSGLSTCPTFEGDKSYKVQAVVDSADQLDESNEDNNTKDVSFNVAVPTPTPTPTSTPVPTPTSTPIPTSTPTPTEIPTPTVTIVPTPTVTLTPTPTDRCQPGTVPGDANGDCKVDGFDYVAWWLNFGKNVFGPENGDFDSNGIVDGFDYVIWWQNFGT